jgi:transcriptional regulator with XRE-family HTH domain
MSARSVPSMVPGNEGFDVLADVVLRAMRAADMNVSQLASASGVSRVVLSAWLNGRRPMRADYLAATLKPLGLTLAPKSRP